MADVKNEGVSQVPALMRITCCSVSLKGSIALSVVGAVKASFTLVK